MTPLSSQHAIRRRIALLWLLAALFAARVAGQALQLWFPLPFLPPFAAFQGTDLPYSVLLSSQLLILGAMVWSAWNVHAGELVPAAHTRALITWLGAIYMAGSLARIAIGLTWPGAPSWFSAWIPAAFHLVLAGFLVTLAHVFRVRSAPTEAI
jgi:hypothetical protein